MDVDARQRSPLPESHALGSGDDVSPVDPICPGAIAADGAAGAAGTARGGAASESCVNDVVAKRGGRAAAEGSRGIGEVSGDTFELRRLRLLLLFAACVCVCVCVVGEEVVKLMLAAESRVLFRVASSLALELGTSALTSAAVSGAEPRSAPPPLPLPPLLLLAALLRCGACCEVSSFPSNTATVCFAPASLA